MVFDGAKELLTKNLTACAQEASQVVPKEVYAHAFEPPAREKIEQNGGRQQQNGFETSENL